MVGGVPARPSHHIVREEIVSTLKNIKILILRVRPFGGCPDVVIDSQKTTGAKSF